MERFRTQAVWILAPLLTLAVSSWPDDALREVTRAEALEGLTEIVMARFTGRTGSIEEKTKEGYSCVFRYETWVFDSSLKGQSPWKPGDTLRVFEGGQGQDCWRAHEYRTRGIDIGLVLPWYASPTRLVEQDRKDARGILLGWLRKPRDFELHCPRSIERPNQADSLGIKPSR